MKTKSNQEILRGIIEKDEQVHQYLYEEILPGVINYVRKNRGTQEDAEDVFQESLLAIHAQLREGPIDLNCKFSTYMFQICKNIWLKQLQRKRLFYHKTSLIHECTAAYAEVRYEDYMDIEAYLIYQKHTNRLGPTCREVIHMRNMKIPYKDIAEKLNISNEAQARKIRYNCKEKLCEMIRRDPAFIELIRKKINVKERE